VLKSPSNPLKLRTIALNAFKARAVSCCWFCLIHALPRAVDVTPIIDRNLSKHVKATCGFVNIARKAEIARRKVFFSLNCKSFPIQTGLNSSLAWSAGEWWPFRKGMFSSLDWGLWVLKFSPIFGVLSTISATDMLESHSRALKTWILV